MTGEHDPNRDRQRAAGAGPLAYFITFHTYGAWLHGDARGSVDRGHNIPGTPLLDPDPQRERAGLERCLHAPVTLDAPARRVVQRTIVEVCEHREWPIHELNVRLNHVHVVLSAAAPVEQAMRSLKSWSTRRLKEAGLLPPGGKTWSRHGSTRYLWKPYEIEASCRYVLDGQGADI